MIPLSRRHAARRAALVSYTRQTLPRPARLYSTPTKKLHAQETVSPSGPSVPPHYPPYMPQGSSTPREMQGFLQRRAKYTILPTPLPDDAARVAGDIFFTDSPTQDKVALMDACLHGLADVPRAKYLFEVLRETHRGDAVLEPRVYNLFLEAYLEMATNVEELNRANWLEDAWALYNDMENDREKVQPTANTYAIMLQAWLRFNPDSDTPVLISGATVHDPLSLLRNIINRGLSPSMVVSDRVFTSNEEATEAIKALSRAAVQMGLASVVSELGLADSLGRQTEDPLADVPEATPVTKPKVGAVRSRQYRAF